MKFFNIKVAGLIQTILMGVLFIANGYFFFVDYEMDTSIMVLQSITIVMVIFGVTALLVSKNELKTIGNAPTVDILALIGLILFTLIALFSLASSWLFAL